MRVTFRAILVLAMIVPISVIGLVGYLSVRRYIRRTERALPVMIAGEATRRLGREVRVGGSEIGRGTLVLRDVTIAEGANLAERGSLAAAASVEIDFSLQRILLESRTDVPMLPRIVVRSPRVHVRRDSSGRWNFAGVFPKQKAQPGRMAVGVVSVVDGAVSYDDGWIVAHTPRFSRLVRSGADRVSGDLRFEPDGGMHWDATGRCITGQAASLHCSGTYARQLQSMLIYAEAKSVTVPLAVASVAPTGVRASPGAADARAVIAWHVGVGAPANLDYRGTATVRDIDLTVPGLREPLRQVAGTVGLSKDAATFDLTGAVRAGKLRFRGSLRGFKAPEVSATVEAPRVDLAALATAFGLRRIAGASVTGGGTAAITAAVAGKLSRPALRLTGSVMLRAASADGARVGPGKLRIDVSGTAADPLVAVSGEIARAVYRGVEARGVQLSAAYHAHRAAADLRLRIARGWASGRIEMRWQGASPQYISTVRVRDVALADLPQPDGHRLAGRADADFSLRGTLRDLAPTGRMDVQVYNPKLDSQAVQSLRLSAVSATAGQVTIESLLLRDGESHVEAQGSVDLTAHTLDLQVEADAVDLAAIAARNAADAAPGLTGLVYLRDGSIHGPWRDPEVAGTLHVYGIGYGNVDFEEAAATFVGTQEKLLIEEGHVLRNPAESTFSGIVRNVLSDHAVAYISGDFRDLEMLDVAQLANSKAAVTGTAHGEYVISGDIRRPQVSIAPIEVEAAGIGDTVFDHLSAAVDYRPDQAQGVWHVSSLDARRQGATLSAFGSIVPGDWFSASARLAGLDLSIFNPELAAYATVAGTASASVDLSASLRDGRVSGLTGTVQGDLAGVTLNAVACGSAHLRGRFENDVLGPDRDGGATTLLTFGPEKPWLEVASAARDSRTGAISVTGAVEALSADTIRSVLTRSQFVHDHADVIPSNWLKPASGATPGTLSVNFAVAGTAAEPQAHIEWTSSGLKPGEHVLKAFSGSADIDSTRLRLHDLTLVQTDATLTAAGELEYGKAMNATVQVAGLNFDELRPWLPDIPSLRSVHGTLDDLFVTATGNVHDPTLEASLTVRNLHWTPPQDQPLAGKEVAIRLIRVAGAKVKEGRLSVAELSVAFDGSPLSSVPSAPPPAPGDVEAAALAKTVASQVGQPYEIHASGDVGFDWKSPFILEEAPAHVMLAIRHQHLPAGRPVLETGELAIDGVIDAEVGFSGTWRQLVSPRTVQRTGTVDRTETVQRKRLPPPEWTGHIGLTADRVRYGTTQTVLSDVDAYLALTGTSIRVERNPTTHRDFSARADIIDPATKKVLVKGDPIQVSGELPIKPGGPGKGIDISVSRLAFTESPLPIFESGRATGEFSTLGNATPGVQLAIRGALYEPVVSGVLNLRRSDIGLPTTTPTMTGLTTYLPIVPELKVDVNIGDQVKARTALIGADVAEQVRVRTAAVTADVRTYAGVPIRLTSDAGSPRVNGTLVIDRGTMEFPTARFTIQPGGTIGVRYPGIASSPGGEKAMDVQVDVTATARMSAMSMFGVRKSYRVTAEARGPLTTNLAEVSLGPTDATAVVPGLRLTFRTDPTDLAASQTDLQNKIVGILGGQEALAELLAPRAQYGRILGQGIASAVSGSFLPQLFERSGIARALGLDELSLDYLGDEGTMISVTRPLIGPISLGYWQRFARSVSGEFGLWEIKTSLKLRSNVQVSWTIDDQRTNAYLLEGVFRF